MFVLGMVLSLIHVAAPPNPSPPVAPACRVPESTPGKVYVEKGTCPGECCTYREWTATADVEILADPGATRVVGHIRKGEKVTAETGEVHVVPLRSCAMRAHTLESSAAGASSKTTLAPGDVFWVLSPVGEGYATIWFNGKLHTESAMFIFDETCAAKPGGEDCWAKVHAPPSAVDDWRRHRWWVRIRTSQGVVGWVDNTTDVLTGFDACG